MIKANIERYLRITRVDDNTAKSTLLSCGSLSKRWFDDLSKTPPACIYTSNVYDNESDLGLFCRYMMSETSEGPVAIPPDTGILEDTLCRCTFTVELPHSVLEIDRDNATNEIITAFNWVLQRSCLKVTRNHCVYFIITSQQTKQLVVCPYTVVTWSTLQKLVEKTRALLPEDLRLSISSDLEEVSIPIYGHVEGDYQRPYVFWWEGDSPPTPARMKRISPVQYMYSCYVTRFRAFSWEVPLDYKESVIPPMPSTMSVGAARLKVVGKKEKKPRPKTYNTAPKEEVLEIANEFLDVLLETPEELPGLVVIEGHNSHTVFVTANELLE